MTTPASAVSAGRRHRVSRRVTPYLFVAPFVTAFLLFLVAPIGVALVNGLYSRKSSGLGFGGSDVVFVGLKNYARAFQDTDFLASFGRVALYSVTQVPLMLVFAATLALLFDSKLVRGRRFFQFGVFLPYAVPTVIAALLWGFLYQPSVSPIVKGLASVGIHANFLGPDAVFWSVVNVSMWSLTGINMLILYSALLAIPDEVYEAARLDGANEIQIALRVKIPMIAPAVLLTTLSSVIGALQLFNEPQILTSITSNINSKWTPNMAIFSESTLGQDAYLGSAMAVILGLATLVASLVVLRLNKRVQGGNADVF